MVNSFLDFLHSFLSPPPKKKVVPTVLCKRSLYISVYLKNAFTKGKRYEFLREDDLVWIQDSMGHEFNFVRASAEKGLIPMYIFEDYFE